VTQNLAAFLSMISHSEGTDRQIDPYRCCFGFRHIIQDLSDHPAVTGEWRGASLDFLGPSYLGKVSTAAGRYQLIKPTWLACKDALKLTDFTGASQDDAAVELIKQKGALNLVNGGQVAEAITLCHEVWASLPGSSSGQPQQTMAALIQSYGNAGGAFA
jgi:muramidase (phage lysozyme)